MIKWWKSRPQGARDKRKRVRSEAMEPRVLFSADLPWTALDPDATDVSGHAFELTVDAQDTEALTDQININELRPTLVVVDESYLVAEQTSAEQLTSDLNLEPGDLRFLDSSLNGITQVSALLEGSSALSSLELLTTAESGGLNLGAQTLGTNDLLNSAQELLGWSDQLDGGAEFNIQAQGLSQFTDSEEFGTVLDQLVPSDVTLSDQVDLSAFVSADAQSQELLFIDSGVENYQALVDDIQNTSDPSRSITVVILDPTRDGVQQISETLAGYSDLDSIHIVSHGSEGSVELGDSTLSSSTLAGYEDELAQWRTALSEDADLLFYGCDIAGNAGGESLVHAIAQLTGADVAASNDLTGAEALGGDWDLEFIAGDVDSQVAFSAAAVANWQQVLTSESGGLRINQDGGNDNFLQADDGDGLLTLATSLTYETRFSSTDTGNQALLSYALPGNDDQLGIIIQSDGDLRLEVAGAGLEINAIDYRTLSDGEPHTLSVTWDNSAGDWAVYVDGELVESGSGLATGQSIGSATSEGVLVLGNQQDSPGGVFNVNVAQHATLFESRLFDDVRTAAEISANYQTSISNDESGLLANWTFDNLSSNGVVTESVSGNNLTVMHATGEGFIANTPQLAFAVDENAVTGTPVGAVQGLDPERQALIQSLLDADENLHYSAETDKFYRLELAAVSFGEASTLAEDAVLNTVDGQLVTIRSAHENALVTDIAEAANGLIWLGATDAAVEGAWRWIDSGTDADLFWQGGVAGSDGDAYSNWFEGTQPNDTSSGTHIARLSSFSGNWFDTSVSAGEDSAYIVEWDADAVLDATLPLTYSIASQTVTGAFAIDAQNGEVSVADGSLLDFETESVHELTVSVTDVDSNSSTEELQISLNNIAQVAAWPTDLSGGIELNTDGGNAAYLQADDGGAILGGRTELTLEIAFSTESSERLDLFSYVGEGAGNDLRLTIRTDGSAFFHVDSELAVELTDFDFNSLRDGSVHSVALSWDNTNGDWSVYVDGEIADQGSGVAVNQSLDGGVGLGNLVFGQELDSIDGDFDPEQIFSGTLYDVRIWNEVRSSAEIAQNYQHKLDLSPDEAISLGLLANWQFEFNDENEVVDIVSANDLVVRNAIGTGFVPSTPTGNLHVSEHALAGATVGTVVPSDPNVYNDIVRDGLFTEVPNPGVQQQFSAGESFGEWTVESGSVDLLGTLIGSSPLGGRSVDLNGTAAGTISQALDTIPGRQYQVIFAETSLGPSGSTSEYRVSVDGQNETFISVAQQGSTAAAPIWNQRSLTFTASDDSSDLRFESLVAGADGAIIGDIRVVEVPEAISTILNSDPSLSYDAATGKFYRFIDVRSTYEEASSNAFGSALNGVSGQLVNIDTEYENTLVNQYVQESGLQIWLGAEDSDLDGNWHWFDGDQIGEQFWSGGSGGASVNGEYASSLGLSGAFNETRLRINSSGVWADDSPFSSHASLIQWDATEVLSSYQFTLADPSNNFEIDPSSGEISVAANNTLNFAAQTSHEVDVTVTDASGFSYLERITVQVDNELGPSQIVPTAVGTQEGQAFTFRSADDTGIVVGDSIDGTNTRLQVSLATSNGLLNLGSNSLFNGITVVEGQDGTSSFTIEGTELSLNAALDGLTFTPDVSFFGEATLEVSTSIEAGLAGNYTFESGDASDQSAGTQRNGILVDGASVLTDPERGEVLSLNGSSAYVSIPGTFGAPENFTVAAWINPSDAKTTGDIIALGDDVVLSLSGAGELVFSLRGTTSVETIDTGVIIDENSGWTHVAATFDDFTGEYSVLVDGNVVASGTAAETLQYTPGADTAIGRNGSNAQNYFSGLIDDARIYDRALTFVEIQALADNSASVSDSVSILVEEVAHAPTNLTSGIELNTNGGNAAFLQADNGGAILGGLDALTIEIAFSTTSSESLELVSYIAPDSQNDLIIRLENNGSLVIFLDNEQIIANAGNNLQDGAVHSIAFTWDNTNGEYSIYIDGELADQDTSVAEGRVLGGAPGFGNLIFGQTQNVLGGGFDADQIFSGTLHDIRIFDEVRSATEIEFNYQNSLDVTQAEAAAIGLIANYQLEFDALNQVVDTIGGNNLSVGQVTGPGFIPGLPLNGLRIAENAAAGALVGTVRPSDPDINTAAPASYLYTLDDPSGNFQIDLLTGQITVAETNTLDFEAATSHSFSVKVRDLTGGSYVETFTVQITDVDDSPVAVNTPPTGTVDIDILKPIQGDTLIASNTLLDADGLSGDISYQWFRDGIAIDGANDFIYTVTQADVDTALTVTASYIDDLGTPESVTSAATADVININDPVVGLPVILGTLEEDQTLSVDTSGISDVDGLGTFSYLWYRDGVAVNGATGATYTLGDNDVGASLTVEVSYTDNQGTQESVLSTAVGPIANVNDAPEGSLVVSIAEPVQGDALHPSNFFTDADGISGPISYQWFRDGVAINGGTGTTYITTQEDVGALITVVGSYIDNHGTAETVTSAPTAPVVNVDDPTTGAPVILGNPTEDQTLTADVSGINDLDGLNSFSYQWFRDGVIIAGANSSTYALDDADVGSTTTVLVSFIDTQGGNGSIMSAGVGPIANVNDAPIGSIDINNLTPAQGDTLTLSSSFSDADGIAPGGALQWFRDGVPISGAVSTTYTVTQDDVGSTISAIIGYRDLHGTNEVITATSTAAVTNVNDAVSGNPVIVGMPIEDETLTADTSGISDIDGLGTFSYQWFRDGTAITGATASTYTLGDADVGTSTNVEVTYIDGHGTAESTVSQTIGPIANINDLPEGSLDINNLSPVQGDTLTLSNSFTDADGVAGSGILQWFRDGVAIAGANNTSYTVTEADVGSVITAIRAYTDGQGTGEVIRSAPTAPVANVNDAVVGLPVIVGTPTEDQTLTVDASGISDIDGLGTFSYQWFRDGIAVTGATGSTYSLGDADVGTSTTVEVSYVDNRGTTETTTSASVGPIANINDLPEGSLLIDNLSPAEGDILTVSNTLSDADGISGAISYQWHRDGVAIDGATAATYTTTQTDVDAVITVTASYVDDQGTLENVASAPTAPVFNTNNLPQISAGQEFSIPEDAPAGSILGVVAATDIDADALESFQITTGNSQGLFQIDAATGEISLSAGAVLDFESETAYVLGVQVSDGTGTSAATDVLISLINVNEAPVTAIDLLQTSEDRSIVINLTSDLFANDSDPEGAQLNLVSVSQPANGVLLDNLDGTLTYLPNSNFNGQDSFTYRVSDGVNEREENGVINVTAINDVPEITTPALQQAPEDTLSSFDLAATDVDGDVLSFELTGGADADLFEVDSSTGALQFVVAPDFEAPNDSNQDNRYNIEVTVSDGQGGLTTNAIQIEISDQNEAPELAPTRFTTTASNETLIAGQLVASDPDANDSVTFQIVGGNQDSLFSVDANNGQIAITQDNLNPGLYELDVQVVDAAGLATTARIEIDVLAPSSLASTVGLPPISSDGSVLFTLINDESTNNTTSSTTNSPAESTTSDRATTNDSASNDSSSSSSSADESTAEESSSEDSTPQASSLAAEDGLPGDSLPNLTGTENEISSATPFLAQTTALAFGNGQETVTDRAEPNLQQTENRQSASPVIKLVFAQNNVNVNASSFEGFEQSEIEISLPIAPELAEALDRLARTEEVAEKQIDVRVSGAMIGTVSLSAGFVVWMLRAGSLMASLLTSKPIWTDFDPLPIFVDDENASDDQVFSKD